MSPLVLRLSYMGRSSHIALITLCLGSFSEALKGPDKRLDALVTFGDSYTDIVSYLWQVWSVV